MKNIIITGCSRGIGLATISLLAKNKDYNIIGTSTSGKHTLKTSNFQIFKLDLSQETSINDFVKQLEGVKIDSLINNAGVLLEDWNVSAINLEQLKQTFDVNLFGTIRLTENLLPNFKRHAHIINVTSEWGAFSDPNFDAFQPHYKMSKAALNMYTKLLAKRLENKPILVSALDPGWTQTDMGGQAASRQPEAVAQDILNLLDSDVVSGQFWHNGQVRPW